MLNEKKCCSPCRPCGHPPQETGDCAQFGVTARPSSGEDLPFYEIFRTGNELSLQDNTVIRLPAGHIYLISYVFLATTEAENFFEILPFINDSPGLLYAFYAPAGSGRNASASASFLTNAAMENDAFLRLNVSFSDTVDDLDISGSVSVTSVC